MPDVPPSDWSPLQQWWQAMGRRLQVEDRVEAFFRRALGVSQALAGVVADRHQFGMDSVGHIAQEQASALLAVFLHVQGDVALVPVAVVKGPGACGCGGYCHGG